jgi:simple sugar transport system ATP-binding protein
MADTDSTDNGKAASVPLLELRDISKFFGNVTALQGVSTRVEAGKVTCVLGDNGAGKSTFIKILSGLHKPSEGEYLIDGDAVEFESPRDARARGIATVYQDLAMAPLMSVWRNFFLGAEPSKPLAKLGLFRYLKFLLIAAAPFVWWRCSDAGVTGLGRIALSLAPLAMLALTYVTPALDADGARRTAKEEMLKMGIDLRDVEQPVGTLSGGERQSVAIARAVYFGARVLILDEPTSALGVRQSGVVLRYIRAAAERGLGVIFITHNPHHAYPVGDRFLLLNRGRSMGDFAKEDIALDELTRLMAGGAELEALQHELGAR